MGILYTHLCTSHSVYIHKKKKFKYLFKENYDKIYQDRFKYKYYIKIDVMSYVRNYFIISIHKSLYCIYYHFKRRYLNFSLYSNKIIIKETGY